LLRYWTGTQWTEQTSPTATAGTPPPPDVSGGGSKKTVWIVLAVVVGVLILIGIILAAVSVPVFLHQREKADDTSAKVDVSTLAREIATWYVDNDGPFPAVETSGGHYYVDGVMVATVSPDVVLGGATGTGPSDWCVWVTNPEGDLKTFEYSSARGLQAGSC
jgi:hypothetical protein